MKKRYLQLFCLALALMMMGCGDNAAKEEKSTTTATESSETSVPEEEAVVDMPTEPNSLCLWPSLLSIRQEADPNSKSITTISINEKLIFGGEEAKHGKNTYVKVKLVDDKEGWVRKDFIGVNATGAAITGEATVYKRPDLMSKTDKKFQPMTVVAITETNGDWMKVRGKSGTWFSEGWIKKSNMTTEELDVVVAAFYMKAKAKKSEESQMKALKEIIETSDFTSSQFITIISDEINKDIEPEVEEMIEEETMEEDTTGGM